MAAVRGDKPTLRGPEAAVVHLMAGRYHLNREGPDTVRPEQGDDGAWNQFGLARGKLAVNQLGHEGEAMLIELALAQTGLIGGDKDVEERRRMEHAEVRGELLRTLNAVRVPDGRALPEARIEATRQLVRKLIAEDQLKLAEEMAQQVNDGPVSVSVAWSEFLRAGKAEQAARMANVTLTFYRRKPPPPRPAKVDKEENEEKKEPPKAPPSPPLSAEAAALAIIADRANTLPEANEPAEHDALAIGKALAAMLQGKGQEARDQAKGLRTAAVQVQGLVALADLARDDGEARAAANEAVGIVTGALGDQVISPWVLARLVRVGARLGLDESALAAVARRIRPEEQLRPWAQLQLFRARLGKEGGKAEKSLADAVERAYPTAAGKRFALSHGLALAELARHNAEKGSDDDVEQWDESLRPYGYIGSVLGMRKGD
jgi:hypothetical protein